MSSREQIIAECCVGNAEAGEFCRAFVNWVHWIDDVQDKDRLWLPASTVRVNLEALRQFSLNKFFQAHKLLLMPLIVQAFRAFADASIWESRPSVQDRRAADVFKSTYHEVIWHVAYLVGGWEHMTAMTTKFRHFDYDCKE